MEYMIITLMAVVGVALVAYPLMNDKFRFSVEDVFQFGDMKQRNYLNSKKALILDNLKELDFDHEMGKLSEEDYTRLRQGYMNEAQETLEAIDRLKVREEIEQLIEGEVRERRRTQ